MKIPLKPIEQLTDAQYERLAWARKERGFNVEKYVEGKLRVLDAYVRHHGIQALIVALSGGIDSAVVLALLCQLEDVEVHGVNIPYFQNIGVRGQDETRSFSQELQTKFHFNYHTFTIESDITHSTLFTSMRDALRPHESEWAHGQLIPYLRTPVLYYAATLLNDAGKRAVIVGTTNRDEGAYLGYVGKASDGMVDIQLISDLHKSEVYQVARYLGVPESIINRTPTGDMYTGSSDEQIFGASYDFVEYRILYGRDQSQGCRNLEELHDYNRHKYLVGSPAVHLDIYESGMHGVLQLDGRGWTQKFCVESNLEDRINIIITRYAS